MPKYYVESGELKKMIVCDDERAAAVTAFSRITDRNMKVSPVIMVSERGFGSDRFLNPVYDYTLYHHNDEPIFSTLDIMDSLNEGNSK